MYDYDDVPIRNPHRQTQSGWALNVAIAGDGDLNLKPLKGFPACAEVDPIWFFPPPGDTRNSVRMAKRVCGGCPIMLACRESHLHEQHGIWGGWTENQRGRERYRRKHGTELPSYGGASDRGTITQ